MYFPYIVIIKSHFLSAFTFICNGSPFLCEKCVTVHPGTEKNTSIKVFFPKKAWDFVQILINTKILFQNGTNTPCSSRITPWGEPHPACQLLSLEGCFHYTAYCPPYRASVNSCTQQSASCYVFTEFVPSVLSEIFTSSVRDVRFCDVCCHGSHNNNCYHMSLWVQALHKWLWTYLVLP